MHELRAGRYLASLSLEYAKDAPPITKEFEFVVDDSLKAEAILKEADRFRVNLVIGLALATLLALYGLLKMKH